MRNYRVGGAVRDRLLGHPVVDQDWVVVGSTPEAMLAAGFRSVGRDFPVFLHPKTHEEYALARTERSIARGYHGFAFYTAPDVTLEQDLARRDLTINAMAEDHDGQLIDPYGGQADLAAGILRHVSLAFCEDPVRILRVARFAARFGFRVADETQQLMCQMVESGEVDALVPERVWQEVSRGLLEAKPARLFDVLQDCGALARIMPEIDALFGVPQHTDHHPEVDTGLHTLLALDCAAQAGLSLAGRYATLCHDLGKALTPSELLPQHDGHEARGAAPVLALNRRLRVPSACAELARLACLYHTQVHQALSLNPTALLRLLRNTDALRRPARFLELLAACRADSHGRWGYEHTPYPPYEFLHACLQAVLTIDAGALARSSQDTKQIPRLIEQAQLAVLSQLLANRGSY